MSDGWGEEDREMGRGSIEKRESAVPSDPKRGASPDFEVVDLDLLEGLPPRHNKVEGGRSEDLSAEGSPPLGAQEPWRDEDGMSLQEIGRARWRRAAGKGNQSGTSSGIAGKDAAGQAPRRNEAEAEHENASFRVFDLSDPPPAEDPWASPSPPRSRKRAASHGISVAKSRRAVDSTMLVNIDDDDDDDDIVMIASSSSSSRGARGASAAAAASSSSSSAHPGGRRRRPGVGGSKYERLDSNQISTIVVDIADSPDASASSSGGAHASSSSSSSGKRRRRQKESQPDDCIVVMERRVEEEEEEGNDAGASGAGAGAGGDGNGIEERAKRARMQVASTVSSKRGFTCPVCMEDEWEKGTQVCYLQCGHRICFDCAGAYVKSKVDDGDVTEKALKCPLGKECDKDKSLTPNEVYAILAHDPKTLKKYEDYSLKRYLEGHRESIFMCPTKGCENALEIPPGRSAEAFECPACKVHFCTACKQKWHQGMSCEGYAAQLEADPEDRKFLKLAAKSMKKCPNCSMYVQKSSGCNAMTCRCKTVFCWTCGGDVGKKGGCHCMSKLGQLSQRERVDALQVNAHSSDRSNPAHAQLGQELARGGMFGHAPDMPWMPRGGAGGLGARLADLLAGFDMHHAYANLLAFPVGGGGGGGGRGWGRAGLRQRERDMEFDDFVPHRHRRR